MDRAFFKLAAPLGALLLLGACVAQPPVRTVAVPAPVMPRMYVYPAQGQSEAQLERDRYDCHTWAVQQSGFDPSRATYQARTVVVAPPPGANTAGGAIAGGILGSILAGPRDSGFGLLFGAATGAIVGSAVDANNQQQIAQAQRQAYEESAAERAQVQAYRRAVTTCLQGRGYTVG
jgi:Glycine zipper